MSTPENTGHKYDIGGVRDLGALGIGTKDVEQIEFLISRIAPGSPVMSFFFLSSTEAEITTGVLAGPLCRNGLVYFAIKNGEAWEEDKTKPPLEWIS